MWPSPRRHDQAPALGPHWPPARLPAHALAASWLGALVPVGGGSARRAPAATFAAWVRRLGAGFPCAPAESD
jgi:hypothetical protein